MGRWRKTWAQRILAALLAFQIVMGTVPPVVRAEPDQRGALAPASFVLDQGLPLELSFDDVFGKDALPAGAQILGMADEGQVPGEDLQALQLLEGWSLEGAQGYQGDIRVWPQARDAEVFLRYTPVDFLSERDVIHFLIQIPGTREDLTVKTVTFLPGDVVYYEEDFPAVDVIGGSFKTTTEDGRTQSADQSLPHGYDPAYAGSADVSMSGGSFATVPIIPPPDGQFYEPQPAVRFTFTGTGFEVITMTDSLFAMALEVELHRLTDDGQQELIQKYPVITSYSEKLGGAGSGVMIYQVPMIRTWGLEHGTYTVQISGVPLVVGYDEDNGPNYGPTTYIYVDGVRIFQPLADATEQEYGDEFGAVFTEPRTLVLEGKAAVLGLETDAKERAGLMGLTGSGLTFREDMGRGWVESGLGGDMKCVEPNNEVYLGGTTGGNALALYVSEEAGDGMLQIGLRDMHEGLYQGLHGTENQSSSFHYLLADGSWSRKVQVGMCGTEQFYEIDYRSCPAVVQNGVTYYQVLLRVPTGMLSLTSLKSVGLSFAALFTDREQNRYRYDGYGLYQAARFAEDGSELPQNEAVWQGAPQDPRCRYRAEDGVLSYAWRYDLQGKELPEEALIWITDGVMPGYHYRLDGDALLRAARFDAYGNEIRAEDLVWHPVGSPVTGSLFRSGGALIAAAEAEVEPEVPEIPVESEEPHAGNWWQRFVVWLKELFRIMFSRL